MLKDWPTIVRISDQRRAVLAAVEQVARERMRDFPPCHDWMHIERVRKLGRYIALAEDADLYIVDLALLLHELDDHKFSQRGPPRRETIAQEVMRKCNVRSSVVEHEVHEILHDISFTTGKNPMPTLNGGVAQDADMLDGTGMIGVARAFTTGVLKKQPLFLPGKAPRRPEEMLIRSMGPASTIAHFYEKILGIKKRMNTKTGKRLAKRRHRMLSKFLYEFHREWDFEEYE